MMRCLVIAASLLISFSTYAQTSLSDQINAVSAAQEIERVRQQAAQRVAADQAARAAVQQRAAAMATEQQRIAAEQQRIAAQAAIEQQRIAAQAAIEQQRALAQKAARDEALTDKKRNQEYEDRLRDLQIDQIKLKLIEEQQKITSDKERDQAYEDKLRALDLQQKALEVKRLETRTSRENDFVDRDLRREDAQTDVIQSGADATRNVSQGAKSLMQDTGQAEIKKQSQPVANFILTR